MISIFKIKKEEAQFWLSAEACFSYVINNLSCIFSLQLLKLLYRKGLSEYWYAHKMLWISNAIIDLSITSYAIYLNY